MKHAREPGDKARPRCRVYVCWYVLSATILADRNLILPRLTYWIIGLFRSPSPCPHTPRSPYLCLHTHVSIPRSPYPCPHTPRSPYLCLHTHVSIPRSPYPCLHKITSPYNSQVLTENVRIIFPAVSMMEEVARDRDRRDLSSASRCLSRSASSAAYCASSSESMGAWALISHY